jgi:hypothetical protein
MASLRTTVNPNCVSVAGSPSARAWRTIAGFESVGVTKPNPASRGVPTRVDAKELSQDTSEWVKDLHHVAREYRS